MKYISAVLLCCMLFATVGGVIPARAEVLPIYESDYRVVLTATGDAHVAMWASDTNIGVSPFLSGHGQSPFFIKFDASDFAARRDEIESVTIRLHVDHNDHRGEPYRDLWPMLGYLIYDPWPASGQLWDETELTWNNSVNTGTGNVAPLGTTMHAWYQNSKTAFWARSPGSFINAFTVDRFVVDKWHEIDITDYVLSSLLDVGERDFMSATGTGWGRDGIISLGFTKLFTEMGSLALLRLRSAREKTRTKTDHSL